MLQKYPIAATADNWLHEALVAALEKLHDGATTRWPGWPDVLPAQSQERLKSKKGLSKRLREYWDAVLQLNKRQKNHVLKALHSQNDIASVLTGKHKCTRLSKKLPTPIRTAISELADFAFGLLTDLQIRDAQYEVIYKSLAAKSCPFCGYEPFEAPRSPREDLDHYLAKVHYPFAAANLRNLVPMGHKCNSGYKHEADMIRDNKGRGRVALDPYVATPVQCTLAGSALFVGDSYKPSWRVVLVPNSEAVKTWDAVFKVRKRWTKSVLVPGFESWLTLFNDWRRDGKIPFATANEVRTALKRYAELFRSQRLHDCSFLKAAAFEFLLDQCSDARKRTFKLIKNLVTADPQSVATGA